MSILRLTLIMFGTTYLGLAILGLGATVSFFALPPLMSRIGAEERLLHMEFRGEYEAYCADVTVTSRALRATSGITGIAAALAETVRADGSK